MFEFLGILLIIVFGLILLLSIDDIFINESVKYRNLKCCKKNQYLLQQKLMEEKIKYKEEHPLVIKDEDLKKQVSNAVKFKIIRDAIENERKLKIVYYDNYGIGTERVIIPLDLKKKSNGSYILKSYCMLRKSKREFKTAKIYSLKYYD